MLEPRGPAFAKRLFSNLKILVVCGLFILLFSSMFSGSDKENGNR